MCNRSFSSWASQSQAYKLKIYPISLRKHSYQEGPAIHHLHHHLTYPVIFKLNYLLSSNLTFNELPTTFLLRITMRKKDSVPRSLPQSLLQLVSVSQIKYNLSLQILLPQMQEQQSWRCSWSWRHAWDTSGMEDTWLFKNLKPTQRLLKSSSAKYNFYSCTTTQHMHSRWFFWRCTDTQTPQYCDMPLSFICCQNCLSYCSETPATAPRCWISTHGK